MKNRGKIAELLRTFLRQDPDVILIGETRDPETAIASMDAAETGHLVFTTLHANTSCSSLSRLLDMEVPKYKLNASVRASLIFAYKEVLMFFYWIKTTSLEKMEFGNPKIAISHGTSLKIRPPTSKGGP